MAPKKAKIARKKPTKTAASKKPKTTKLDSVLVQDFPCKQCLAMNVVTNVTGNGDYSLHMHLGCLHAIVTAQQNLNKTVSDAEDEIIAAQSKNGQEAPPAPKTAPRPNDPAFG